jgi:hypothetical protein
LSLGWTLRKELAIALGTMSFPSNPLMVMVLRPSVRLTAVTLVEQTGKDFPKVWKEHSGKGFPHIERWHTNTPRDGRLT